MPARDLKLAREGGPALPRNHPLYRRKLELSAKHTALAFGHRSLLENCPLFLCLILGVHSRRADQASGLMLQGIYRRFTEDAHHFLIRNSSTRGHGWWARFALPARRTKLQDAPPRQHVRLTQ